MMGSSPPSSFSDLPGEVILRICLLLDVYELHAVSNLNRKCHAVFKQHLEFDFACKAAGVISNSRLVSNDEKLRALARREESWKSFNFDRFCPVDIPIHPSNLYDLSAGYYVLGSVRGQNFSDYLDKKTKYIAFADLSNYEGERVDDDDCHDDPDKLVKRDINAWGTVKAHHNNTIVDFGLCVDEHDLIALVEIAPSPDGCPITLHLHKFSTGEQHPTAKKPIIQLGMAQNRWGLSIMLEVVGPHLVLLLKWNIVVPGEEVNDRLLLINWISGDILVEEESPGDVWEGIVFLNCDIFLVTDARRGCLDVIHILQSIPPKTSKQVQPRTSFTRLLSFELPTPVPEYRYYNISCRSDPNPFWTSADGATSLGTEKSQRALFSNDPKKAIIIFRLVLTTDADFSRFSFVVHRSTLLRYVEMHPKISSNSMLLQDDVPSPPSINWNDWGSPSTRWLCDDSNNTPWITTTSGQREAFMRECPDGEITIAVRDFNPCNVRRAIWEKENGVFDDMEGRRTIVTVSRDMDYWEEVFSSDGEISLPCIEVESAYCYEYDGVLIDETRILGLKRSDDSPELASFDVHTISVL